MRLRHPLFFKTAGLLAAPAIRSWMETLDCKFASNNVALDPAYPHPGMPENRLYLFWHEYILYPLAMRGHCRLTMLLSRHADADIVQELADRFGFKCVRGSTNRGGAKAIREMRVAADKENLTIAADGPRGPRREMALGPLFIASRLRIPVVLLGLGYERPWRVCSWDRFAIPRPGSRLRGIFSEPFIVPPKADRVVLEHYRRESQTLLTDLSEAAEHWALSGCRMRNEYAVLNGPKTSLLYDGIPR